MSVSSITGGANALAAMQQMRERMFSRADADDSGGLSLAELQALGPPPPAGPARPAAGPAGGSASGPVQSVFDSLDTDQDGTVSQAEIDAARPPAPEAGGLDALQHATMSALLHAQEASRRENDGSGDLRQLLTAYGTRRSEATASATSNITA